MVFKIPLIEQTQLPPSRAGIAKPDFSTADRSGEINFGASLAKFGGEIFEENVRARAVNEQHEFMGAVNTAQQQWAGFVANNPGTSFADLQKERDKMMTSIANAGQKVTTGIAKNWTTNWFVANKNRLYEKTQATMDGIVAKQEFARFEATEKQLIKRGDRSGLDDLYDKMSGAKGIGFDEQAGDTDVDPGGRVRQQPGQVPAGAPGQQPGELVSSGGQKLLSAEQAAVRKEAAFAVIDAEQAKTLLDDQLTAIVQTEGWEAGFKWLSDEKNVRKLFTDFGIPLKDINAATNIAKARMKERQAEEKIATNRRREKQNQVILDTIESEEPFDINSLIATSPDLSVDDQIAWLKYSEDHNKAILEDDIANSPVNLFDPLVNEQLLFTARHNPNDPTVQPDALFEVVKLGRTTTKDGKIVPGGITTAQRTAIENARDEALKDPTKNPLNDPSAQRAQASIGRLRQNEIRFELGGPVRVGNEEDFVKAREIEDKYLKIGNDLDKAILDAVKAEKPLTGEQIEKQTQILVRPEIEEITLGWLSRTLRKESGVQFFGLIKSEQTALVNKKIKRLQEEDFWETLTEEDKKFIRERVERGATVEDILRLNNQ